jgi:hypothetical protein
VGTDPNPVAVEAALAPDTGVVQWRLTSVDRVTGELVEDPRAGFLPPNDTSHRGEGHVSFSIRPRSGLPLAAVIRNQARIVFDVNPPIDTPVVVNTIDGLAPASQVNPLPARSDADIVVSWQGSDGGGSGLVAYDVYVSQDGGRYRPWLQETPQQTAVFPARPGSRYAFFSVSRDLAGNREAMPARPDATTEVPTVLSLTVAGQQLRVHWGSVPGREYQVEAAAVISEPLEWAPVLPRVRAQSWETTAEIPVPGDRQIYLRVLCLPAPE